MNETAASLPGPLAGGWLPAAAVLAAGLLLFVLLIARGKRGGRAAPRPRREPVGRIPYDPERQIPVIRSSICTGEKAAGFKDRDGGKFVEVMLIRCPEDERRFKELYHLDEVKTEY